MAEESAGESKSGGLERAKVVIVPGNGCVRIMDSNWYGWLATQLRDKGIEVAIQDMPDPYTAREFKWLPFMKDVLGADERSIVVGHSSGAAAGVRYAEDNRLAGLILVSAYHTDQGDSNEARSGYFSRPWHFDRAAANCGFVDVFGSNEDPFLALEEQKTVAHGLGVPLRGYPGRGHFMERTFPELLQLVLDRIKGASPADAPVMYAPEGDDK